MSNLQNSVPAETSRRITSLRFLLAVFVVFIHNNFTAKSVAEAFQNTSVLIAFNQGAAGKWIQLFISGGIARCAVPLFFLFAAYLQFKKGDSYGMLLRKKVRSLVLPFFLWPVLNIALFVGMKLAVAHLVPRLLARPDVIPQFSWTAADWLHAFFGYGKMDVGRTFGGYLGQMWFVRDLFILIVLSPLLRRVARSFPVYTLVAVSFFYFCDVRSLIVAEQALFYYVLGFFWAEYDVPLFEIAERIKWRALIPLYLALWLATWFSFGEYSPCYWFMVLATCLIMLKCAALIERNERAFAAASFLAPLSFWLFAVHQPFLLGSVQSVWLKLLPMTTPARCLAEYFCVNILTVAFGTASGLLLRKICPPLFSVLNGGRK
ncbi:MAG: acyltransferase [Treponemataceae bacterium]|nr:acyltransferase [Treponemataceae bacterium]